MAADEECENRAAVARHKKQLRNKLASSAKFGSKSAKVESRSPESCRGLTTPLSGMLVCTCRRKGHLGIKSISCGASGGCRSLGGYRGSGFCQVDGIVEDLAEGFHESATQKGPEVGHAIHCLGRGSQSWRTSSTQSRTDDSSWNGHLGAGLCRCCHETLDVAGLESLVGE